MLGLRAPHLKNWTDNASKDNGLFREAIWNKAEDTGKKVING
jgi:hypothetical protein